MRIGEFLGGGLACGLVLCLAAARLLACANDYEDRARHSPLNAARTGKQYIIILQQTFSVSDDELQRKAELVKSGRYQDISDYAVALLRHGDYQQSRDLLEPLAAKHPDEYIIAANLGTAYELTGDLPNALKWIRRGIELNPQAHDGTEWLHAKILLARQEAQQDPKWFDSHHVVLEDFGNAVKPVTEASQNSLFDLRKALEYQLYERLAFVEDPDAVVADLLLSLGNVLILTHEEAKAHEVFKLAKQYDVSKNPLLDQKIAAYEPQDSEQQLDSENWLMPFFQQNKGKLIAAGAVVGASILLWGIARSRRGAAV
jgi:tetratricopeptide (TPR) repeat protein